MIGSLGDITFYVTSIKVLTFSGLSHTVGACYTTHKRIGQDPLLEFTGVDVEKLTLNIRLMVSNGVNPLTESERFCEHCRKGTILRFLLGKKQVGKHKWVITSISNKMEHIDNKGLVHMVDMSLTLQSYAER